MISDQITALNKSVNKRYRQVACLGVSRIRFDPIAWSISDCQVLYSPAGTGTIKNSDPKRRQGGSAWDSSLGLWLD